MPIDSPNFTARSVPAGLPPPKDPREFQAWSLQQNALFASSDNRSAIEDIIGLIGGLRSTIITDADGYKWRVIASPMGTTASALGYAPFQLVPATVVYPEADPYYFLCMPGIIESPHHVGGAEAEPTWSGQALTSYPLMHAGATRTGLYARCRVTYDGSDDLVIDSWTLHGATSKPAETALSVSGSGTVTPGIYYRRIGTAQYTGGALILRQDRIGPWTAEYNVYTSAFYVWSPWFQSGYVAVDERET